MSLFYRHYKGGYYQVVGEALDTQDDSIVVIYRTLYPSAYSLFSRPKELFFGSVRLPDGTVTDRFQAVEYDELPEEARARVLEALPRPTCLAGARAGGRLTDGHNKPSAPCRATACRLTLRHG